MEYNYPNAAGAELLDGYVPVTLQRQRGSGWTAERQRAFLVALSETGCISEACAQSGITARSAYRLRAHADGASFAAAWDKALRYATSKLLTLAYERAIRGTVREIWRDGRLVGEVRTPSDRMLALLLTNLAPWNNDENGPRWSKLEQMTAGAAAALDPLLGSLQDSDVAADALSPIDYAPPPISRDDLRVPFDENRSDEY